MTSSVFAQAQTDAQAGAQAALPPGDRLRDLAERLDVPIGYASRFEFETLDEIDRYRQITSSEFNIVTPENSLKWEIVQPLEGEFDFTDMDALRDYANENGMALHGHPIVWYLQNPPWAEALAPAALEQAMVEFITTTVSRYAGEVGVWDVVNEPLVAYEEFPDGMVPSPPLKESIFLDAMGPAYIDTAFEAARAADPDATLLLNDYNVGWLNPKADAFYELVVGMQERGVPLDGVGFQMHLDHTFINDEGFSSNMQRFADLGLEVYITEFDVGVLQPTDYEVQGEVYERMIERCLMQPECKAFQIWGIDDFYSWRPFFDPLPWDDDFNEKPAYFGMQRALSTWPVHVEQCEADAGTVVAGDAYFTGTAMCRDTRLSPRYQNVAVRYRNPGVDTASLTLRAGDQVLAIVDLPPVAANGQGEHATLSVPIESVAATTDLEMTLAAPAGDVGIDALLFRDPQLSALIDSGTTGSSSGGGFALHLGALLALLAACRLRTTRRRACC